MSKPTLTSVARRERAIGLTVAASIGAKVFSVICTLVQVPIALHYLGTEAYGFWVTLVSIVLVLNFVDFGLGVGMQHAMARSYGNDDIQSMKRVFWTGTLVLVALGSVVTAISLPAAYFAPWADILHIHDPSLRTETTAALLIAVGAFVIALPFSAVTRLAAAVQRGWINAGWIAGGSLLSLAFVTAAARCRWGFLWFLAASLLVPAIQGFGLFVHLMRTLDWSLKPTSLAPGAEIRSMLLSSALFAFPQFGLALIQSTPALAISMAAGTSSVTAFNLLLRLFGPFQQGQIILLTPVWPAYTEAHARGDHAWVSRTFWRTIAAFVALASGLAAVACMWHPILSAWVGTSASAVSGGSVAPVAAWCLLQMAAQPFIYYLTGVGRLRQLAWAATPGLLLCAASLFLDTRNGGVGGVLEFGSMVLALALLPPLLFVTVKSMREHESELASP